MLSVLWTARLRGAITSVALSESGGLAAVSDKDDCATVFDSSGAVLGRVCSVGKVLYTSYCCGWYGFIDSEGYALFIDDRGKPVRSVRVGTEYSRAIAMAADGFVVCSSSCAMFDYSGRLEWMEFALSVPNSPAQRGSYWYIPSNYISPEVKVVRGGTTLNYIEYEYDEVIDVDVCGYYLAVSAESSIALYDLSDPQDPELIWGQGLEQGGQLAFSPDCRHVAVADTGAAELNVYRVHGELSKQLLLTKPVSAVDWRGERLAIGSKDGLLRVLSFRTTGLPHTDRCSSQMQPNRSGTGS